MRAFVLGLTIAITLGVGAGLRGAGATPALPNPASIGSAPAAVLLVKHHCGKGQRWVAAGYAKRGKYRVGHCAPVSSY